jgi:hypothetical protein
MSDFMKEITLSGNVAMALEMNPTWGEAEITDFTRGFTTLEPEVYGETPVVEAHARAKALGVEFDLGLPFSQGLVASVKARQKGYQL